MMAMKKYINPLQHNIWKEKKKVGEIADINCILGNLPLIFASGEFSLNADIEGRSRVVVFLVASNVCNLILDTRS